LKTSNGCEDSDTSISSQSFKHDYLQTSTIKGIKFECYSPRKELNKTKNSVILSYLEPTNCKEKISKSKKIKGITMDKSLGHSYAHMTNK
jgi:hypothetical protein